MISYIDSEEHAARTAVTRAVITDFARLFYLERDVRRAFETFVAPGYIQHNPGIPDGRDAAIAALTPMFSDPDFQADLKRVLADGDYGVIHLHGYRRDQRAAPSWTSTAWLAARSSSTGTSSSRFRRPRGTTIPCSDRAASQPLPAPACHDQIGP